MTPCSVKLTFHDDPRVVTVSKDFPLSVLDGVIAAAAGWCGVHKKSMMVRPWPGTAFVIGTSAELDRWAQERAS